MSESQEDEGEIVDGLPVVAESRTIEPARQLVPARQAAALAATGFMAGAATVAAVHRRRSRTTRRKKRKGGGPIGEIMASNSFLVDVHLIKRG